MMILVIGGSCQGKREFAATLAGIDLKAETVADGRTDAFEQAFAKPVILYFHQYIARLLEENQDPAAFTELVLKNDPEIIVLNEVGYGIVPIDQAERYYREAVGRCGQLLAAKADAVYRVICGIGNRIK